MIYMKPCPSPSPLHHPPPNQPLSYYYLPRNNPLQKIKPLPLQLPCSPSNLHPHRKRMILPGHLHHPALDPILPQHPPQFPTDLNTDLRITIPMHNKRRREVLPDMHHWIHLPHIPVRITSLQDRPISHLRQGKGVPGPGEIRAFSSGLPANASKFCLAFQRDGTVRGDGELVIDLLQECRVEGWESALDVRERLGPEGVGKVHGAVEVEDCGDRAGNGVALICIISTIGYAYSRGQEDRVWVYSPTTTPTFPPMTSQMP